MEGPSAPGSDLRAGGCWGGVMAEETRGPDRDWDSELSGEVDSDEDECRDGERGGQPGTVTGTEPPSDLGPAESGRGRVSRWGWGWPDHHAGPWWLRPGLRRDHDARPEAPRGRGADHRLAMGPSEEKAQPAQLRAPVL